MNSNFTASKQINTGETPLPYTASPWKLLVGDLRLVLKFFLYIPSMFRPLRGANGPIDELSPTRENKIVILVHVILSLYQTTFLISLPVLGFWMPVPAFVAYIVLAYWVNEIICRYTLNTGAQTLVSTHPLVPRKCHSHERWIFLNGITVGTHWMQNSVNRLSQTFARPVTGIHTPTSGFVFDLIRCLIQRNFCYATQDVRDAYAIIKQTLWDDDCHKLILIAHSQGGIAASLIVDWLVGEVSQGHLNKLEIYTFGNAANHFNDPRRLFPGEDGSEGVLLLKDRGPSVGQFWMNPPPPPPPQAPIFPSSPPQGPLAAMYKNRPRSLSAVLQSPAEGAHERETPWLRTPFIEHYANSDDFVCRIGVIHYINMRNRYLGHVFQRNSPGHLFVQHYLDPMFPLDGSGIVDDASNFFGSIHWNDLTVEVECRHSNADWHLSRLWQYRGGRSPIDHYGL